LRDNAETGDFINILAVDDDESFLTETKLILLSDNADFKVDTATSVDEALKKMQTNKYDAIVSDYDMPLNNGLDFLRQIHQTNQTIPFFLFASKAREEVAINALNLGAEGYYNKHGEPEVVFGELAHAIKRAVSGRRMQMALVESENRYRQLIEQAVYGIFVHDLDNGIIDVNESACRTLGYSKEDLLKMAVSDINPKVNPDATNKAMQRILSGEKITVEAKQRRKDGAWIDVEVSLGSIKLNNKNLILANVRDITERKKTELQLVASEFKYRSLVEDSLQGILITRVNPTRLVFANKSMAKMLGYSIEELLNLTEEGVLGLIYIDDRPAFLDRLTKRFQGERAPSSLDFRAVRKDGSVVWLTAFSNWIEYLGEPAVQGQFLEKGQN
jgi:PAS domain S-box-containing protein